VRVEHRDGATLVVSRLVAPGAAATTLGRFIFVKPTAVDSELLLRHELVHVRQWRELGVVGFLRRYLGAYLRWRLRGYPHWAAYRRVPLEIEAEWEAREPSPLSPGGDPL
jgi:hypothetical protein